MWNDPLTFIADAEIIQDTLSVFSGAIAKTNLVTGAWMIRNFFGWLNEPLGRIAVGLQQRLDEVARVLECTDELVHDGGALSSTPGTGRMQEADRPIQGQP